MCDPENTKQYDDYAHCKHRLPRGVCDYFSYAHQKCYAGPDFAKDVPVKTWENGEQYFGICPYCKDGKDLSKEHRFGANWKDRLLFK